MTSDNDHDSDRSRPLRSFGRLKARGFKASSARLLEEVLPRFSLNVPGDETFLKNQNFNFKDFFQSYNEIWLEIGFGGGEHLVHQAKCHPDKLFLGAEPFHNGLASCLRHIETLGLENIRIYPGDVRDILKFLPNQSLSRVFILFPDPWPKARHQKRRLINPDFVTELARLVINQGLVRFATDWADYANQGLFAFHHSDHFLWQAESLKDWALPPQDHIKTRYQEKALGDIAPVFFNFKRLF